MWSVVTRRLTWLDPTHPIAKRETRRNRQELPRFVRRLTDGWTLLGYAAMLHGIFFAVALLSYNHINQLVPNVMLPFMTPFGTPIAAAFLHSILYWAMLIGVTNFTSYFVASDIEARMWPLLRTTPYSSGEILAAKLTVVGRIWGRVLRTLVITRLLALALIPLSMLSRQGGENYTQISLNVVGGLIFVFQPLVDAFLVACLSALAALTIRGLMWARVGAYAVITLAYSLLSGFGGFWLIYKSPLGTVGGVLIPLNIWAPLISSVTPSTSNAELVSRTLMLVLIYGVLPLLLGVIVFRIAARVGRSQVY